MNAAEEAEETSRLLDALAGEWAAAFDQLRELEILFSDQERVDLLNRVAGPFFAHIQQVMFDDLLLRISRLTDDPGSGSRTNLTIRRLPALFKSNDDLAKEVEAALQAQESARIHRNRRLSHTDLKMAYAVGQGALPRASLSEIRQVLDSTYAALKLAYTAANSLYLSKDVVSSPPRAAAFAYRLEHLADAVLLIEELLCEPERDPTTTKPQPWDEDFAEDRIRKLGASPSRARVRRLINLHMAATRLKKADND